MGTLDTLAGAQQFIEAHGGKLSGSRARGDWADDSDWDYWLSLRVIRTVLKPALDAQGVRWESPMTGAITWYPEGTQVEVSDLFPKRQPY